MPAQLPIPPAARSPYGPDGAPKAFSDVTHRVRHAAERLEHADEPVQAAGVVDPTGPLLKLIGALACGYVLGAIIHRRAR